MAKKKRIKHHYVDNKKFLEAMIEYKIAYNEAIERGEERLAPSSYVAECIMLIAQNLAKRPNFSGYTFKEEMIGEGIINCLTYIHNFDPEKSRNPFAYFTQIIYYAFLRYLEKEKKQSYVKYKVMDELHVHNINEHGTQSKKGDFNREHIDDFIESWEERHMKKKNEDSTPVDVLMEKK